MAKIDLLANEDFKAYQSDLLKRREDAYGRFDELMRSAEYTQEWCAMICAQRAVIMEYDLIIGIPESYVMQAAKQHEKAGDEKAEQAAYDKAKRLRSSARVAKFDTLKRIFGEQ